MFIHRSPSISVARAPTRVVFDGCIKCEQLVFSITHVTMHEVKTVGRGLSMHCCYTFGIFCRVLRPPGGGSSDLFGGYEDDAAVSRKPHKMASNIFGTPEQSECVPKRSNPPGPDSVLDQIIRCT